MQSLTNAGLLPQPMRDLALVLEPHVGSCLQRDAAVAIQPVDAATKHCHTVTFARLFLA